MGAFRWAAGRPLRPAPGATTAAPAGLETVPLELEFVGNFFNLADFFHHVKRFVRVANSNVAVSGRLITVEGVRWSSDAEIFPLLRAEIKATIYLSPKVAGRNCRRDAQPGPPDHNAGEHHHARDARAEHGPDRHRDPLRP